MISPNLREKSQASNVYAAFGNRQASASICNVLTASGVAEALIGPEDLAPFVARQVAVAPELSGHQSQTTFPIAAPAHAASNE